MSCSPRLKISSINISLFCCCHIIDEIDVLQRDVASSPDVGMMPISLNSLSTRRRADAMAAQCMCVCVCV